MTCHSSLITSYTFDNLSCAMVPHFTTLSLIDVPVHALADSDVGPFPVYLCEE